MKFNTVLAAVGLLGSIAAPAWAENTILYLDSYCKAEGMDAARCSCAREQFLTATNALEPTEIEVMAFLVGQGGLDPVQIMEAIQSFDQTRIPDLMMQLLPITMLIDETCAAPPPQEDVIVDDRSLPVRDRFIAICERDMEFAGVCDCMAGSMETSLDPLLFELLVDIKAAEAAGDDNAFETIASERGLTVQEAEEALALYSTSIVGMVGPIMACVPDELRQMKQGGFSGMIPALQ